MCVGLYDAGTAYSNSAVVTVYTSKVTPLNYGVNANRHKKPQMRLHWLYIVVSSIEFKDQNKGDHGNIAQCAGFLLRFSTLIIIRNRSSL